MAGASGVIASTAAPGVASAATQPFSPPSTAYWALGSNGQAVGFGSAFYGDMRSATLDAPVVGGAVAPDGDGYWMVGSDGGVFNFGSAAFHGSEGGQSLAAPVVGMAADPATGGYWLVGANGQVYSFDAPSLGGAQLLSLVSPIVGIVSTPDGLGYWLVAADGGIFSFGDATFFGSMGGHHLDAPVSGMTASPDGHGYWLVGKDGGIFTFGDAPFLGSAYQATGPAPVVGVISTGQASLIPPSSTGYDVSQWQCHSYSGEYLPDGAMSFGVTQVSGGAIDSAQPAGCYNSESEWAGENQLAYIFMDPEPQPGAPRSMAGPAGNCASDDLACQSFNYGWNWADYWVSYAGQEGTHPLMWFLDVETSGGWSQTSTAQSDNSQEIMGAIDALKAAGAVPGIYSDNYQWQLITGGQVSAPGIPIWMAGASDLTQAEQFCTGDYSYDYQAFAGGQVVMAQYVGQYDQDYACPESS